MLRVVSRLTVQPTVLKGRPTPSYSSSVAVTDRRNSTIPTMAEVGTDIDIEAMATKNKKVLLLLDVNGTLCYRTESRISGIREDLHFRKRYWYGRKHIGKFLRDISNTTAGFMYHVCVYTSMMTHNAKTGVNAIVPPEDRHLIHKIFDRQYNKPGPEGTRKWDTMRDMTKIWNSFDGTYDATNTILVDNEVRKFKETPRNGIIVPEFGAEEAIAGNDDGMEKLAEYLVQLADSNPDDVRDYMDMHPFTVEKEALKLPLHSLNIDAFTNNLRGMSVNNNTDVNITEPNKALKKLLNLPEGTTVHLKYIEGTYAVMKDENSVTSFKVKVRDGVRIESKMNLQRLIRTIGLESIVLN